MLVESNYKKGKRGEKKGGREGKEGTRRRGEKEEG